MKTPLDQFTFLLERLSAKVEELEARISALEQRPSAVPRPVASPERPATVVPSPLHSPSFRATDALATGGRVFLGIAGAYLLRYVAESGVLPRLAVVVVALAYAVGWLAWAGTRTATGLARAASAITAALILSPMLWEVTLSFHMLPAWVTAAVLAGFALLAAALAWKRDLRAVVGVATLAAAVTTLALLVATRDPAPFMLALLVMALGAEAAACRDRWLDLRPIVAIANDLAALALILIYTRPEGAPAEYEALAPGLLSALVTAAFVIYGAGTIFRTVVLERKISVFEFGQTVAAFLLAAVAILRIRPSAAQGLGAFFLLAAAAAYLAALTRLARLPQSRNYHVFATWAAALFLAGSVLLLPFAIRGPWLALAAAAALVASIVVGRMTLGFHGAAYIIAAALVSGLLKTAGHVLVGNLPFPPGVAVWMVAGATILCYAIAVRYSSGNDPWSPRLLRLIFAALAAFVALAVAVILIAMLVSLMAAVSDRLLAVIRTLSLCLAALALAFAGSHWNRLELVWLAYAFIAFCTVKLLFEDMPLGSTGSIAASFFFYGMAWVFVPRLARRQ